MHRTNTPLQHSLIPSNVAALPTAGVVTHATGDSTSTPSSSVSSRSYHSQTALLSSPQKNPPRPLRSRRYSAIYRSFIPRDRFASGSRDTNRYPAPSPYTRATPNLGTSSTTSPQQQPHIKIRRNRREPETPARSLYSTGSTPTSLSSSVVDGHVNWAREKLRRTLRQTQQAPRNLDRPAPQCNRPGCSESDGLGRHINH